MGMAKLCEPILCTGCMACSNVCPAKAIVFAEDSLGCLMPSIDSEKCIDCGLCSKICPQLEPSEKHTIIKAYALYAKDAIDRKLCASVGVATTLGRYFLQGCGVVSGTTFGPNGKPVMRLAENERDLEAFRGSKYVYCEPGDIYLQVKERLRQGKQVLFIGLPCQVDACKKITGDSVLLTTVDLICHGAPPYTYLKEHLQNQVKAPVVSFSFRGLNNYVLCAFDRRGNYLYKRRQAEDAYFSAFMDGLLFRENCFQCKYAERHRIADITIGDFWGLQSGALGGYQGRVSVALCNTEKGLETLDQVKDKFVWEERNPQEAIAGNTQLREPSLKSSERNIFSEVYRRTGSFTRAIRETSIPWRNRKAMIRRVVLMGPKAARNKLRLWRNNAG